MKCLVIGLGSMGKRRIRNLRMLGLEKITGFDLNSRRGAEVAAEYDIAVYTDVETAFHQDPDVVIVSTPPDKHMSYAIASVKQGIPVFTEAGTTIKEMQTLISLAQKKNCLAVPSCTLRFHPAIQKIREIILNKGIGKPLAFTYHCGQYLPDWHPWEDYRQFYVSQKETGACREIVPFELNWLIWIFGWPTKIAAFKGKVSDLDCHIDDVYQIIVNMDAQLLGHVQVDVLARSAIRYLRVVGSEGTLEWHMTEQWLRVYEAVSKRWTNIAFPNQIAAKGYSAMSAEKMYEDEIACFLSAVRGESKYPHSFRDDFKILTLLLEMEGHRQTEVLHA